MAKSLRCKRRRKMRNLKRQKNAPKELATLKKTLGITGKKPDVEMKDLVTVTNIKKRKGQKETAASASASMEVMEVDEALQQYDKKTLRDKDGQYPVWMSQRNMKRLKKKNKAKGKTKKTLGRT